MNITSSDTIAFIGLGIMGAPIATHMLEAGYTLQVYTRTKSKAEPVLAKGAIWKDSIKDAVAGAKVVFTMLGYPEEIEEAYLSSEGILAHAAKGAYLVDLTTSDPQLAKDIHDAAEIQDLHAFDCPVTGGEEGAIAGTLVAILGADETYAASVLPLIKTFSSKQVYCGGAGKGQIAKLCNQLSLAAAMVGYADALALAQTAGLDLNQVQDLLSHGMGQSAALDKLAPKSIAGDFKPGFMVEHLRKDIGLALATAENYDLSLPGAETSYFLYDVLAEIGGARMGTQAITLLYADRDDKVAAGLNWDKLEEAADEDAHDHAHDHDHEHHHHHHHHHED